MCHKRRGENLSAILPEKVRLNRSTSEEAKTNYHLIVEEYDRETITHNEAETKFLVLKIHPKLFSKSKQYFRNRNG